MGDITHNKIAFHFAEASIGNGKSRGITIKATASPKPAQTYKLEPNPHNDPWYNKNQGKFYTEAATELAKLYVASSKDNPSFPRYDAKKIKINNIEYKLAKP
jgi:hypothetical protein